MDMKIDLAEPLLSYLRLFRQHQELDIREVAEVLGLSRAQALDAVKNLKDRDFISSKFKPLGVYQGTPAGKTVYFINLNGINYLELKKEWWRIFRIRSVYIPIGVSIATTLAVLVFIMLFQLSLY